MFLVLGEPEVVAPDDPSPPHPAVAPVFWTSADGTEWQVIDLGPSWAGGRLDQLVSWNGQFLAASVSGEGFEARAELWQSIDGLDWRRLPDSDALDIFTEADPGRTSAYIAVLKAHGDDLVMIGHAYCENCAYFAPDFVVRWRSADGGQTWQRRELKNYDEFRNYDDPVPIGDRWARISPRIAGQRLEISTDKENWEPWELEGYAEWSRVRLTPFGAVAVGAVFDRDDVDDDVDYEKPTGLVLTSTDGVSWTQSTGSPALSGVRLTDVAGTAGALVALGFDFDNESANNVWVSYPLEDT
jgi:hypothetical protein